ncbi:MAG: CheY-like receiver [bacterium]|nr:CheY-like receiver [bacterium]
MNTKEHLIVYVDDERPNRIVFEQSFGNRFNVRALPSGQAALELLRTETAAVLITDQRMPDMSGHDLLVKVKQLYPDMMRVVITAYSDLDPILAAVNEGLVARYIIKPWDRAEVEQILLWSLEAFSMGRQKSALQLRLMQTERLVTLGSMAAAVLHDLHQPLTNLMVNVERLSELGKSVDKVKELMEQSSGAPASKKDRALVQELVTELPELARDLLTSCKVMTNMTIGLKQFLRAEPTPEPSGVDPVPIVQYAIGVCRETAVRARGRISYEGPTTLPKLHIGSTELTQVLINVVANGAQALLARNKSGGRVVVAASEVGGSVQLTVDDNGPGMSAEILRKVGTPFFSTRPEGTGLGVAQCRRLVEGAGGTFRIDSIEGQGTTVTFSLPKV